MANYKALILRSEDETIDTFNESTHLWKYIDIFDNITPDSFSNGFSYSNLKTSYTDIYLKFMLINTYEDGSTEYQSEEIKADYGVTLLEESEIDNEPYLKCTVPSFTPYDNIKPTDKILLYSNESGLLPTIESIIYRSSGSKANKVINIKITTLYNYNTKIKIKVKVNDGEYSPYSDLFNPYDGIILSIPYSELKVGDNLFSYMLATEDETVTNTYNDPNPLTIYNDIPIIAVASSESDNFKVKFGIDDLESDKIKYRILLSNSKYTNIILKDWSDYIDVPFLTTFYIESDNIIMNETNVLTIEATDNISGISTANYSFMGKYRNLIFINENNEVLSTDKGIPLRFLNFGQIVGGYVTEAKKVRIQNNSQSKITNLNLNVAYLTSVENAEVQLSKTQFPFVPTQTITFGTDEIEIGEEKEFFVRVDSEIESFGKLQFKITAEADSV